MPKFSIVIPTFNRPASLERCVASIGKLECARQEVEVIVVNDGGSAPDGARLSALANGIRLRVLSQSRKGPGAARNHGAFTAAGKYLALLDDDCVIPADWAVHLSASTDRNPDGLLGGRTINLLSRNKFAEASQTLVDYVYSYYNEPGGDRTPLFTSNNMVIPAAIFRAFGGFDEAFRAAEDRELCRRLHNSGVRCSFDPSIVVYHANPLSLLTLIRQHFNYGQGALPYWEKNSRGVRDLKVEPLSFYAGMVSFPFRVKRNNAAALSALIALTQVANAAGFAFAAMQRLKRKERAPVLDGEPESAL